MSGSESCSRVIALGWWVLLGLVLVASTPWTVHGQQSSNQIWQLTYLKALPGRQPELEQFLDANWFAMDRRAVAGGHLVDFQLLRGTPADTTWDLLEITVYRDSLQHAQVDSVYRTIYRPSHVRVLINGRGLPELGRIVRTETLRRVAGATR